MYPSTFIYVLISELELVLTQILLDHQQQIYLYRLLYLPNNHFTKKFLLISFCNGDGDITREDEQPKDIIAWTKIKNQHHWNNSSCGRLL